MLRQNIYQVSSPTHSSSYSHSSNSFKGQLNQLISSIIKEQHHSLSDLSQKCSTMEYAIGSIEVLITKITQKIQKDNEKKQGQMLGTLKIKQYQFFISQLKSTIAKQFKKQERLTQDLECQKKKVQKFREELFKFQAKNSSLTEKITRLNTIINEKSEQIQHLSIQIHKLKFQSDTETIPRSKSNTNLEFESKQHYNDLQSKLQQLQKQLQYQITMLQGKNKDLNEEIRKIQEQYEEQKSQNKVQKKQIDQISITKYQIQLKLKQQTASNVQLQQLYKKLLQKSNNTQILLHKQIQELKSKEIQRKQQYKKQKKNCKSILSSIAQAINNSKYYLTGNTLFQQGEEVKRLYEKITKRKTDQYHKQIEKYQLDIKKLKDKIQVHQNSLIQLEKKSKSKIVQCLSQREIQKYQSVDRCEKGSQGGTSFIKQSSQKSQGDKYKNVEEKYKIKIQTIRKDLKIKQTRINQLQKQQQHEFDKSKEKILQLQLTISEKINEIRKFELNFKEKQYEIQQLKSIMKQLQSKNTYLNQKNISEKQSNQKILDMKTQNYEQKIKNLKTNYKQLEKKEQQKTIKYNKLKSKYEKYEMEASESLKRKNTQIDQLLKQNSKIKTQIKLLEQKININNIIEKQINPNKTPAFGINEDLIEQVEIERDRINNQLAEKEKKCNEVIDTNSKLNSDNIALKKQIRELKYKTEQLIQQNKQFQQQNKLLKSQIQQLSRQKQQQNQEKHSHFKKQLQKCLINLKKQEKACEKYAIQKQGFKKQIEQKQAQITNLKISNDKVKQKLSTAAYETDQLKEEQKRTIANYEIKLLQFATKETQLVDIINYKNREGIQLRQSMKGQQLIIQTQKIIKIDQQTSTQSLINLVSIQVNTDLVQQKKQIVKIQSQNFIIPSEILMDQQFQDPIEQILQKNIQSIDKKEEKVYTHKQVNYFNDLVGDGAQLEDHFDICQQGQEINIGQSSLNLQIKELFNCLRKQLQKLFNQQEISIQMIKVLPRQLEDDFNDFMSYIKQKIYDIKNENNLSFIMAEAGSQQESIEQQLVNFISKEPQECMKLRKIIQEKQIMITGLMNQKTEQQHTINQLTEQKQEVEEENENRFMNQCSVYKKEIRQYKKQIDMLEMNCQSLKNIFKNTMDLWVEDNDNQDDLKDNFVLYSNICKLNQNDKKKINSYLDKYRFSKMRS